MMGLVANAAFYSSVFWNLLLNKLSNSWQWYTRIDQLVILGALPTKGMIEQLTKEENVAGVVCLNMPYEMDHDWVARKKDWEEVGVSHYWVPVPDFIYAPKASDVQRMVKFIRSYEDSKNSVYVHCKAGRSRSATVVACYLMEKHGWTPEQAVNFLLEKRYQVVLRAVHWNTLKDYAGLMDESSIRTIREGS